MSTLRECQFDQKWQKPRWESPIFLSRLSQVCVPNPENSDTEAQKEHLLAAYRERPNMRVITRLFWISRNTLSRWLKKVLSKPNL